jgi:hypothetical protein
VSNLTRISKLFPKTLPKASNQKVMDGIGKSESGWVQQAHETDGAVSARFIFQFQRYDEWYFDQNFQNGNATWSELKTLQRNPRCFLVQQSMAWAAIAVISNML